MHRKGPGGAGPASRFIRVAHGEGVGAPPGEGRSEQVGVVAGVTDSVCSFGRLGVIAEEFIGRFVIAPGTYPVEPAARIDDGADDEEYRLVASEGAKDAFFERISRPEVPVGVDTVTPQDGGDEPRERPIVATHPI